MYEDGTIAFAFRHVWEKDFLEEIDEKGVINGDKTLEALGSPPTYFVIT